MARKSQYERDLRREIRDSNNWPGFSKPDFFDRLDKLATGAVRNRNREGDLAAILVYHQLVEEMLRLLIRDSHFLIRLAVFPGEITFRTPSKQMFGQHLQSLKDGLEFPKKKQLLLRAGQLNTLRIEVVHRLVARGSLNGLRRLANRSQRLYEDCYQLFEAAHDHFRLCFKDYKKDVFEEF